MFYRLNEEGNAVILDSKTGEAITRIVADVSPVESDFSVRCEHPEGIVLTVADAEKIGIHAEDFTGYEGLKIVELIGHICHKKPTFDQYFPAYIEVDFEDGTIHADWTEDENSTPRYVFDNRATRYKIPSNLAPHAINKTMAKFLPDFNKLAESYEFNGCERSYIDEELNRDLGRKIEIYSHANFDCPEDYVDTEEEQE